MASVATLTDAEFDLLPYEEGRKWELTDTGLIPVPSATPLHQKIARKLLVSMDNFLTASIGKGECLADLEFALDDNHRLRPDVLFLTGEHVANLESNRTPVSGAPDIAIEIILPSERKSQIELKRLAYLRFGAAEVWQVFPESATVLIHRNAATEIYTSGDLTTPLLPGFSLPLETLFA